MSDTPMSGILAPDITPRGNWREPVRYVPPAARLKLPQEITGRTPMYNITLRDHRKETIMTRDPYLLIPPGFMQEASILRHYEKQRVATQNRIYALTSFPRKKDWGMGLPEDHRDVDYFRQLLAQVKIAEDDHVEHLSGMYVLDSPLHQWSGQVKGLAPGKLVARFLGETGDPYLQTFGHDIDGNPIDGPRVRKVTEFKSYVGMMPDVNDRLPGKKRGEQSKFKSRARTRLWLITDQVVKQHDPVYYPVFEEGLEFYADEKFRGTRVNGQPRSDEQFAVLQRKWARVKVGAAFLEDIWEEARRLHSLPDE